VELLITLAIIGLLVAILFPSVQAVRASAQRTTCMNNLRQVGLGLVLHHETHQVFPAGGIEWRAPGTTTGRQLAWSVYLLPFIEQADLYDRLDLSLAFDAPRNAAAAQAVLPVFLCPTSLRGASLVDGRGPCDYGGIYGERIASPNQPPKGLMIYDQPLSLVDVVDGASKTFIVGEDTRWSEGQWINGRNVFDQAYAINAAPPFENDIRSDHRGGALAVLADASVRWLPDDMDLFVLASYCTRAGKEIVFAARKWHDQTDLLKE
jgi:hypothetical protein